MRKDERAGSGSKRRRVEIAIRNRPGRRPFVLNEEARRIYLESRSAGATIIASAGRAGVAESTIRRALARGNEAIENEDDDPIEAEFARFARDEKRARGNFTVFHLANIANPEFLKTEWQRSAWLLERTDDSFKRFVDVTHRGTGPNGAILKAGVQLTAQMPIVRDLRNLSDEQVETLNQMMLEARNGKALDDLTSEET